MSRSSRRTPTRAEALEVARYLGCSGAHQREDGVWQPCASADILMRVSKEGETSRLRDLPKSAEKVSKRKKKGWEHLRERGLVAIDTIDGGGLISGKDILGAGRRVRATDPDVFSDPDSARVRSRQLGCIGIRRYNSMTGTEVWMPCNNESDYRRRIGIGPQARRDKERAQARIEQRVIAKLKKSDDDWSTVRGGKSLSERKDIRNIYISPLDNLLIEEDIVVKSEPQVDILESTLRGLLSKVRNHNKRMDDLEKPEWSKASISTVKQVWKRGAQAYGSSVSRKITRNEFANQRVNSFLRMLEHGKPENLRYISDVDLLPELHPWKTRRKSEFSFSAEKKAARKIRSATAKFEPDAVDADNDGRVQDGTAFERPSTPRNAISAVRRTLARTTNETPLRRSRKQELGIDDIQPMMWSPDQTTAAAFGHGRGRGFTRERVSAVHKRIMDALRGEVKVKNKQGNKTAYIIGGPVAVGKSTLRTRYGKQLGIPDRSGALHLDPDEIRELLPEYDSWLLNPMVNAAELTHAESMHLVEEGVKDAIANNLDVVHDTTGRDFRGVINELDRAGYKKVAHFATGDLKQAIEQSAERARQSGRWRDPQDISRSFSGVASAVQNYINADMFDEFYLWDTTSRPPVMIAKKLKNSPIQVFDQAAWRKMLNGGK